MWGVGSLLLPCGSTDPTGVVWLGVKHVCTLCQLASLVCIVPAWVLQRAPPATSEGTDSGGRTDVRGKQDPVAACPLTQEDLWSSTDDRSPQAGSIYLP